MKISLIAIVSILIGCGSNGNVDTTVPDATIIVPTPTDNPVTSPPIDAEQSLPVNDAGNILDASALADANDDKDDIDAEKCHRHCGHHKHYHCRRD